MAALQMASLATITLNLRQDGAMVLDYDGVDPKELVEVLDSGREEYEHAHTIASLIGMVKDAHVLLNDDIKKFIT